MRCKDNFYYLCKRKVAMKRVLFSVLLLVLILTGCSVNDYKKLQFKNCEIAAVDDFEYAKASAAAKVRLDLEIANPSRSSFSLNSLKATLYMEDGKKFADAVATDTLRLEPKSDGIIPLYLDAVIYNPTALLFSSKKLDPAAMTADIDAEVSSGPFKKHFKEDKYPVKDLLDKAEDLKKDK